MFGTHLGAILDYKLELNLCHHLSRKWGRRFCAISAPFLHLYFKLLKNLKCFLLEIDERSFLKVRKRILKQYNLTLRLRCGAVGHLQLACKDVNWRIIIHGKSGCRACK
jgi:hypothetical protein